MGLDTLIGGGALSIFILLSLIQIAPIKLNPWTAIGNILNKDLTDKVDDLKKDIDRLEDKVNDTDDKALKRDMDQSRARILRFADEIRRHEDHSKEFFDHILDDISAYEHYCAAHPDYENEKAVLSIAKIRETYQYCDDNNKFL